MHFQGSFSLLWELCCDRLENFSLVAGPELMEFPAPDLLNHLGSFQVTLPGVKSIKGLPPCRRPLWQPAGLKQLVLGGFRAEWIAAMDL